MNISPDTLLKYFQIASAIWAIIFGSKALIEVLREVLRRPPPGTTSNPPAGLLDSFRKVVKKIKEAVKKIKRSTLLNVILAIVVLAASSLFLVFFNQPCPPFAPTSVTITSPASESKVTLLTTVQGTACHIPNGMELWVLIVPDGVTGYYPQSGPVMVTSDGEWSASAHIGLDTDVGRGFVLIAALADQEGSAAIRAYFKQSSSKFKGLDPLPSGIQLRSQVHVVRT